MLRGQYELPVGGRLGPGPSNDKEAAVLNRIIRWADEGAEYEVDPRQAEQLLEELELGGEGVKGVVTPGQPNPAHQVRYGQGHHIHSRGIFPFHVQTDEHCTERFEALGPAS